MSGFEDYFRDVRARLAAEATSALSSLSAPSTEPPSVATATANAPAATRAPRKFPAGSVPALHVPPGDMAPEQKPAPLAPPAVPFNEDGATTWRSVVLEAEIIAVLDAPARHGETIAGFFERKEHELYAVCDRLTIADARILFDRLRMPTLDDPIVARLSRWNVSRQLSVQNFVGDARRREALRLAKRGRR